MSRSKTLVNLSRVQDVYVLQMDDGCDNRLSEDMCLAVHEALDEVERRFAPFVQSYEVARELPLW